jgi:hypothetical protein
VRKRYWIGAVGPTDDFDDDIGDDFIDGKTTIGPWAIMTPASYRSFGIGLGTGRGQWYRRQADGKWLKTEG